MEQGRASVLTQLLEAPITAEDEVAGEEHGDAAHATLHGGATPDPAWGETGTDRQTDGRTGLGPRGAWELKFQQTQLLIARAPVKNSESFPRSNIPKSMTPPTSRTLGSQRGQL